MLCTPVGAWFEDAATENHQSSSLLDSDPVAAIDILDIFTTNDSHISVPVCVELLPTLVRFMAASSLIEEDGYGTILLSNDVFKFDFFCCLVV